MPNKLIEEIDELYQNIKKEDSTTKDFIDKLMEVYPQLKQLIEAGENLMKGVKEMDGMKLSECGNLIPMYWHDWKKQQMDLIAKYQKEINKEYMPNSDIKYLNELFLKAKAKGFVVQNLNFKNDLVILDGLQKEAYEFIHAVIERWENVEKYVQSLEK